MTIALWAAHPPRVAARGYQIPFNVEPAGGFNPMYSPPDGVVYVALLFNASRASSG